MNADRSYCCASVPSACAAASKRIFSCWTPFCFFGFGIGVMKATLRTLGEDPVRRLAARVQLPVAGWVLVGRVQDRLLEESRIHLA